MASCDINKTFGGCKPYENCLWLCHEEEWVKMIIDEKLGLCNQAKPITFQDARITHLWGNDYES